MTGHVLIVGDDQSMAETLTNAMTRRGFVVTWKTSAADALALLDEQGFDVVVRDVEREVDMTATCGASTRSCVHSGLS